MNTKNVIFEINAELKHKFKKACLNNRETQKEAMNRLVKYYIDSKGQLMEGK